MESTKVYRIQEAAIETGVDERALLIWVQNEWIIPAHLLEDEDLNSQNPYQCEFDEEDLARVRLIRTLQAEFGVNDNSIDIILHLLDQVHHLQQRVRKLERQG